MNKGTRRVARTSGPAKDSEHALARDGTPSGTFAVGSAPFGKLRTAGNRYTDTLWHIESSAFESRASESNKFAQQFSYR